MTLRIPCGSNISLNSLYLEPFQSLKINAFFAFYTEIQAGRKICRENYFWQKVADDRIYVRGQKLCQNHSILHRFRDK